LSEIHLRFRQSHQRLSEIVIFRGQSLVLDGAFIKRRVETSQIVTISRDDAPRSHSAPVIQPFRGERAKVVSPFNPHEKRNFLRFGAKRRDRVTC
jgi:hypothetical protein